LQAARAVEDSGGNDVALPVIHVNAVLHSHEDEPSVVTINTRNSFVEQQTEDRADTVQIPHIAVADTKAKSLTKEPPLPVHMTTEPVDFSQVRGQALAADVKLCPNCHSAVEGTGRYCQACGHKLQTQPTKFLRVQNPKAAVANEHPQPGSAQLVMLRGSCDPGRNWTIPQHGLVLGRTQGHVQFEDDSYLSVTHALFSWSNSKQLCVRASGEGNGVFIKLRQAERIMEGDRISVGRQVLAVLGKHRPPVTDFCACSDDGTKLQASPMAVDAMAVARLFDGGSFEIRTHYKRSITLGRECADLNFYDDDSVSEPHARILKSGGYIVVEDLGSLNGTFVSIRGQRVLRHGDQLLLGRQTIRVEIY
jgi:hypothetical protein